MVYSSLIIFGLIIIFLMDGCVAPVFIKQRGQRVVQTRQGRYRGVSVEFPREANLRSVEAFLGMSYASLRGGKLKFMPPATILRRSRLSIKDASNNSYVCPQKIQSEEDFIYSREKHAKNVMSFTKKQTGDCLTLNLYMRVQAKWIFLMIIIRECYTHVIIKRLASSTILTRYGEIRGVMVEFPHNVLSPVEAYFGLQFGATDGKDLRFMPPTSPKERWAGTLTRKEPSPPCPQKLFNENEILKQVPNGTAEHLKRIYHFINNSTEEFADGLYQILFCNGMKQLRYQ
ncbi:hypothetical protein KUTeg_011654 [Tegillarca granosa]|uniref:Carboxylesterase type B domain-containing protein n=1 Tax=Tegillarca granosa TaxID=220873 RepID=A0ABQ9EX90_TEGGR|nr:hypothetical protein KUTeg_011654 [Tegillarca granosa]